MSCKVKIFTLALLFGIACTRAAEDNSLQDNEDTITNTPDLQTSATSAKLLNLGSLFGYGNSGYYPSNNRPGYYPSTGYYPNSGYYPNNGYYPSTGNYPTTSYYPNTGNYPNSGYYPSSGWTGGNYPSTNVGGYYPSNTYYPSSGAGTNILGGGSGGYGGYGGNGGFRQYSGYWNPNYMGQRNRGFGYYTNTDLYGLPKTNSDRYGSRERDRVPHSFRGYD